MLNKQWKEVTGNIINNLSRLLFDKNQTRSQCTERPEQQSVAGSHTRSRAPRVWPNIIAQEVHGSESKLAKNLDIGRTNQQTQRIKQRHERSRERLTQQQWVNKEEPEKLKLLRKIGIYQAQVSCGRNVQSTPRAPRHSGRVPHFKFNIRFCTHRVFFRLLYFSACVWKRTANGEEKRSVRDFVTK